MEVRTMTCWGMYMNTSSVTLQPMPEKAENSIHLTRWLILMSEIVAEHHKNKDKIEIYDPTSGSGSLLITIGKSIGRHIEDKNKVKYYAQELRNTTT